MKNPLQLLPSLRRPALRYADGVWPTLLLLMYILSSLIFSVWLSASGSLLLWIAGVLLLGHGLTVSAYLIHDLTHQAVFRDPADNARLGRLLAFITGACYGRYNDIRLKHMRHHVERTDVVAVDYRDYLQRHPVLRRLTEALEWAYIPAVDLLMHALVMLAPYLFDEYRDLRRYTTGMMVLRITLFAVIAFTLPAVALAYVCAYLLMIHVLRLMDMHQHTYEVVFGSTDGHDRPDAEYERQNTFSNPLGNSVLLNLLVLNFGYHNAHHERPTAPWYRLPALHRELYGDQDDHTFAIGDVLANVHRYRVARVMGHEEGVAGRPGFTGLYGVSFLTTL